MTIATGTATAPAATGRVHAAVSSALPVGAGVPTSLVVFTTSQFPLALRYEHPRKPVLVIPPLVHRSLHAALDGETPSVLVQHGTAYLPHPDTLGKQDIPSRPTAAHHASSQHDPSLHHASSSTAGGAGGDSTVDSQAELASDSGYGAGDAEVTVKIHLVGSGSTSAKAEWIESALSLLGQYKGLRHLDTLLLGFRGVDYKGKKTAASEMFGCGAEGLEGGSGSEYVPDHLHKEVLDVWAAVKTATAGTGATLDGVTVGRLGTMYLPLGLLRDVKALDEELEINALDTPDCHSLPKEYSGWARDAGIELWAGGGGEGSDPLPSAHLHNLLFEFNDKIAALGLGRRVGDVIPLREDGLKFDQAAKPAVDVRWVLSYTLVSRTRGIVRDKGYVIMADIQ